MNNNLTKKRILERFEILSADEQKRLAFELYNIYDVQFKESVDMIYLKLDTLEDDELKYIIAFIDNLMPN